MKKTLYMIAMVAMMLTSCNWLEENPAGLVTEQSVEDGPAGMNQLVTGVYSKLIYDTFCWGYFPKVLEMDADYVSGPDWLFSALGAGNFQGDADVTDALWKCSYGLIGRANYALLRIRAMKNLTDKERANAEGELLFLRAWGYFWLVRAYGPVPIQTEEVSDGQIARSKVEDVYAYIVRDLTEAVDKLYLNTDSEYHPGHVCAGSAAGLLVKALVTEASSAMPAGTPIQVRTGAPYIKDSYGQKYYAPLATYTFVKQAVTGYENIKSKELYEQAIQWAEKLILGRYGTHTLLAYEDLWKNANRNASEFLFCLQSVNGDSRYKNSVFTMYEGYKTAEGSDFIQSGGWIGCTRHWYDLFEKTDKRITLGVKHRWRYYTHEESNSGFYYPYDNETAIAATGYDLNGEHKGSPTGIYADGVSYYYSMDNQCLAFTTKYMDVTNEATEYADANYPFLRLADVLLCYAEALNETTEDGEQAMNVLSQVQTRSGATPATVTRYPTQTLRRSMIIEERAKELACESDRRWDLIRWGIYLDAMNIVGVDDGGVIKRRSERNLLFPIPAQELNTNKCINANNPGWN